MTWPPPDATETRNLEGYRCVHPRRDRSKLPDGDSQCLRCQKVIPAANSRKGRTVRRYGTGAELKAARKYGGQKIGHANGPVDIRGKDWSTQMKTHRRLPPAEWTKAFQAMSASTDRMPRLLLRFLPGPGLPPKDYYVIEAQTVLDYYGKDE